MLETKKKSYRVSEIASMFNFSKEMLSKKNNVLDGVDITYKAKNCMIHK